jgi:hypothetical protein
MNPIRSEAAGDLLAALEAATPPIAVEFPGILAYAKDADEFVRLSCREHTGWRRDEWAYSPLFICGKFHRISVLFPGFWA